MTTETRPRGRPRKTSAEKSEQFSIRMPALNKTYLEMYSRATSQSLSQAVADMVLITANNFQVDGETLASIQKRNLDKVTEQILKPAAIEIGKEQGIETVVNWIAEKQSWLIESDIGRLFLLPESLLNEEEKFFVDVFFAIGVLPEKEDESIFYNDVKTIFALDGDIENAVRYIKSRMSRESFYAIYAKIVKQLVDAGHDLGTEESITDALLKPLRAVRGIDPQNPPKPNPTPHGPAPRKRGKK